MLVVPATAISFGRQSQRATRHKQLLLDIRRILKGGKVGGGGDRP